MRSAPGHYGKEHGPRGKPWRLKNSVDTRHGHLTATSQRMFDSRVFEYLILNVFFDFVDFVDFVGCLTVSTSF